MHDSLAKAPAVIGRWHAFLAPEDQAIIYLSAEHRDNPGNGCAVAAIGSEMFRKDQSVCGVFTAALGRRISRLAERMPHRQRRRRESNVLGMIETMADAMISARAVDDPKCSERIPTSTRAWLKDAVSGT